MELPEQLAGLETTTIDGTVLVTGSTGGVGKEAALAFGRLGADLIVHGRDRDRGMAVRDELRDAVGVDARFVRADFADQAAVLELADAVREETDELALLVNNAGGLFKGALAKTGTTDAGIEFTFAVNHLAPFVLTHELLPLLEAGEAGRVVTTASEAHRGGKMQLDTLQSADARGFPAYNRSKLANIMFTNALARRLDRAGSPVEAVSLHPGVIPGSGFARNLPGPLSAIGKRIDGLPGVDTAADGGANVLYAGLAERVESGWYVNDLEQGTPTDTARDRELQEQLWAASERLTEIEWPLGQTETTPDRTATS